MTSQRYLCCSGSRYRTAAAILGILVGAGGILYVVVGPLPWLLRPSYTLHFVTKDAPGICVGTRVLKYDREVGRVIAVEELSREEIRLTLQIQDGVTIRPSEEFVVYRSTASGPAVIRIERSALEGPDTVDPE